MAIYIWVATAWTTSTWQGWTALLVFKRQSQPLLRINPKHSNTERQGYTAQQTIISNSFLMEKKPETQSLTSALKDQTCTKRLQRLDLSGWTSVAPAWQILGKMMAHVSWPVLTWPLAPGAETIRSSHSLSGTWCTSPCCYKAPSPLNLPWAQVAGWKVRLSVHPYPRKRQNASLQLAELQILLFDMAACTSGFTFQLEEA